MKQNDDAMKKDVTKWPFGDLEFTEWVDKHDVLERRQITATFDAGTGKKAYAINQFILLSNADFEFPKIGGGYVVARGATSMTIQIEPAGNTTMSLTLDII